MSRLSLAALSLLVVSLILVGGCAPEPGPETYEFESTWGASGGGDGEFWAPYGVAVGPDGEIYVADTDNNRIQKFSPTHVHLATWGERGTADGEFLVPYGIAVGPDGEVYVADTENHRIQKFSPTGVHLASWGTQGSGDGQFDLLSGVAVDSSGNIYVADTRNHRIQKLSPAGEHLASWGSEGAANGQFDRPSGVAVDSGGSIYVADTRNSRIQRLDSSGAHSRSWGTQGAGEWQFDRPSGIAVNAEGRVFVADTSNHRIVKFDSRGTFSVPEGFELSKWGVLGDGHGEFKYPWGVAFDARGDVYVADRDNDRIQRFTRVRTFTSIEGADRYETAIETSEEAFPAGAQTVLIATGTNWPDALGGAALAGRNAPILLTRPNSLPASVLEEIRRLDPEGAIILGGTGAVSQVVEDDLVEELGEESVTRIGGLTRYETAIAVAEETLARDRLHSSAFVATGANFPDALAASPIAAAWNVPIYLAGRGGLSAATRESLENSGVLEVVILGSTGAVSEEVEAELVEIFGELNVDRIGGTDRYETAANVAQQAVDRAAMTFDGVAIATGSNFPDALAGGVLQGKRQSVLLLTRRDALPADAANALDANREYVNEVRFLGGVGVVGEGARAQTRSVIE